PRSIYALLDRNRLSALYAPVNRDTGTLTADRGSSQKRRRMGSVAVARSQSPDREDFDPNQRPAEDGDLLIPPPSLMGIADPVLTRADREPVAASGTTRRASWQPTPDPLAAAKPKRTDQDESQPAAPDQDAPENRGQAGDSDAHSTGHAREL